MPKEESRPKSQSADSQPYNLEVALSLINLLPPVEPLNAHSMPARKNAAVDAAVDKIILKIAERLLPDLQQHLDTLQGKDFGHQRNVELARNLNRIFSRLGCQLACPKCGEAATAIRYVDMSRGGSWLWRFEHTPARRHGGTVAIPVLKVRLKHNAISD